MISRRFVNLAANATIGGRPSYQLHRINVSDFFYPMLPAARPATQHGGRTVVNAGTQKGACSVIEDSHLPAAAMTFHACPNDASASGTVEIMPLLGGSKNENDIVTVDQDGRAVLYGVDSRDLRILPPMHAPKYDPISLAAAGSLYVMKRYPCYTSSHFFEALVHGKRPDIAHFPPTWYWRPLPPPPFAYDPREANNYEDWGEGDACDNLAEVAAHTVAGPNGSEIWVTHGGRTYSFDTAKSAWAKLADWALPFRGRAEYVPEHGLWFGLSSSDGGGVNLGLRAADLSVCTGAPGPVPPPPPRLHGVWEDVLETRNDEGWEPMGLPSSPCLVPLGCGRFCDARMFMTGWRGNFDYDARFAVLTGLEVQRCGDGYGTWLRMVKHRSRRYDMRRVHSFRVF